MPNAAKGETEEDFVDEQGTLRKDLITKANAFGGERGWDGPSYWRTYNGSTETGGWNVEETYSLIEPDVFNLGVADLQADGENSFLVQNEYSEISSTGGVVYSERIWDSQSTHGYMLEALNEKAYSIVGWYAVYDTASCSSARRLQEAGDAPEGDDPAATGEPADDPAPVAA